jgi:hypothetical protein
MSQLGFAEETIVATHSATGIVFWVVVRDKNTRKIISTRQFATHEEAVHYHPEDAAGNEVDIEILAPGKQPKG